MKNVRVYVNKHTLEMFSTKEDMISDAHKNHYINFDNANNFNVFDFYDVILNENILLSKSEQIVFPEFA